MKIALSSYSAIGAWFILRLLAEGHDVDYYLSKSEYGDVLKGLVPKPKHLDIDLRYHVEGYGFPNYSKYDLSLFDLTGRAKQADYSKSQCPTLGDGTWEHILEDDREQGIQCMEHAGIPVPPYQRFDSPSDAKAFIKKSGARYVYKPFTEGGTTQDTATTYVAKNDEDMLKNIDKLFEASKQAPFILQEFIKGTEIGIEGFFNGEEFYCLTGTLEEKKFMNDNKGPNTGCAGNLIFTMNQQEKIYEEGLKKAIPLLNSIGFRGILDLNTIVTDTKVYALEWTPRFGYNCCPTIATMYGDGYGDLLHSVASGKAPQTKWAAEFGFSTTLTIPPYPSEIRLPKAKEVPIEGINLEDLDQICETYLYDCMLSKDKKSLVTSGNYGYVCAPMGVGRSAEAAWNRCDKGIERIQIPNMQYRTDIYESTMKRYNFLKDNDWI